MISDEQKYANKIQFMELLGRLKVDITSIYTYLETVDYFNKPFTAQSFKAYSGGLCEHALNTCAEMMRLCKIYCPDSYTEEDIILVSLLKDIYRAELYEVTQINVKNEQGNWESAVGYKTAKDRHYYGDLGFSSFMTVRNLVPLTDEQVEAICYADSKDYSNDITEVKKQYKLVTLATMAGIAAYYL